MYEFASYIHIFVSNNMTSQVISTKCDEICNKLGLFTKDSVCVCVSMYVFCMQNCSSTPGTTIKRRHKCVCVCICEHSWVHRKRRERYI